MFGLSRHSVSRFSQHANPAPVNSHRKWSIPVSTPSDFAVFHHENVCQPSFLQSKLRSIRARLSHLQTVIDGQESRRALDNMSKLHRSRLDTCFCTRRSGSSQLASDETMSRTACSGTELHCKPTQSVDQLREICPSPTQRSSTHCSDDVRVEPVIGFCAGGSETNVTPERERLTAKAVRDMIAEVERKLHHNRRSCATPCTILERHPVRRSARGRQCTEKSRRHQHLVSPR